MITLKGEIAELLTSLSDEEIDGEFYSLKIISMFEKRIDQFYFDEPDFNNDLMIKIKEIFK